MLTEVIIVFPPSHYLNENWYIQDELRQWLLENVGEEYEADFGLCCNTEWHKDQLEKSDKQWMSYFHSGQFQGHIWLFKDKDAAILFKLTWG